MKLSKAAETQRMSHRGFQSLCHIRVPHRATPAYVVVTSSDLDTSRNKASVSGLSWISRFFFEMIPNVDIDRYQVLGTRGERQYDKQRE